MHDDTTTKCFNNETKREGNLTDMLIHLYSDKYIRRTRMQIQAGYNTRADEGSMFFLLFFNYTLVNTFNYTLQGIPR